MEKQNYRKIELTTTKETFLFKKHEVIVYKLKNNKNVYVSSNCHIKPRGLHIILKHVYEALKEFDIKDSSFVIKILSYKDGLNTFGTYDAISNVVYLNETICEKDKIKTEKIEIGHVERHELWHLKQAEIYKLKFGLITKNNYSHYIFYTRLKAKKFLDSLGINDDNVGDISDYASDMFDYKRYDEVEAEIKAKKGALCIAQNSLKKSKI